LICPYCNAAETKVLDTRASEESVRRRRECFDCGKRFTTYERVERVDLVVIKKDGRREPFNREKIKSGIIKACEKRPVPMEAIEEVVGDIENRVRKLKKTEVPTRVVGELVIKKLRKLDKVAYIRFASVYKQFSDVSSFAQELKELQREPMKVRAH